MFKKIIICVAVLFQLSNCAAKKIKSDNDLLVFVGKQVSIEKFEPILDEGTIAVLDAAYKAKYKILETVYGEYLSGEVIEFEAYDHYGFPQFGIYKTVLLFVSEKEGRVFHQKYQYYDVYKTKNGKWATCGNPYESEEDLEPKPLKDIIFEPEVSYNISHYSEVFVRDVYASPTFKLEGDKAICVQGTYVDELFEIKKATVLKARGLFE